MTNTSLGLEIFVRFYYKTCSTKPGTATTSGFLYVKKIMWEIFSVEHVSDVLH
jgi:hypothetical protein